MPPRVWLPWDSLRPLSVAPLVAVILLDSWLLKCVCVTWSRSVTVSWVMFLNEREVLVPRLTQEDRGTRQPDRALGARSRLSQSPTAAVCTPRAQPCTQGACAARARNQRHTAVGGARSGHSHGTDGSTGPGSPGPRLCLPSPCSPEQQPAFPSWSEHGGVASLCPGCSYHL